MPHEPEQPFHERVVTFLEGVYGEDNVESGAFMEESYRFADVIVDGPVVSLAIEIENDFEAVIDGVGQAILYASIDPNAIPVVVVPKDHVDDPEVDYIREYGIPVVEMDV